MKVCVCIQRKKIRGSAREGKRYLSEIQIIIIAFHVGEILLLMAESLIQNVS